MKRNGIVVMGGSFNPPTIAHFRIMQAALDAAKAETGYFVPVGFPYLKRKMMKLNQSHLSLSDELRLDMLRAMIGSDARMQIDRSAMDKPFSDDVALTISIQGKHPDADVYYVSGDDKLGLLDTFAGKSDFFTRVRCILFSRDSLRLMDEVDQYAHLSAYKNALIPVSPIAGMDHISSSKVREHLFDIDAVKEMLHPAVHAILQGLNPEDYPQEILQFKGEYAFLSNDFPAQVEYDGVVYPCAASAFLASMCSDPMQKRRIACLSPEKAKQKYGGYKGTAQWEIQKTAIMAHIVRAKFQQNPELAVKLLQTGNQKLINGGGRHTCWSVNLVTWEGENLLGVILMKLRKEWKEGNP
ncbi:MAG: DUF1768 domain-containing protein [Clostridia bacterium]|nr:DUF1768 domain-containing protein [Clostridia bacterium]